MSDKGRYVILDDQSYADHYCRALRDDYVPIVLDDVIRARLEAEGIDSIGILDYLTREELRRYNSSVFRATDRLLSHLDDRNRGLYRSIFGCGEINLMRATMNYLFKRFMLANVRFIKGLDSIMREKSIKRLAFLHDGYPQIKCSTKKQRGFFFPDDIAWRTLECWSPDNKPGLELVKAPRRAAKKTSLRDVASASKAALADRLKRKPFIYDPGKKTLLAQAPLYDLGFLDRSAPVREKYNVLLWDPDRRDLLLGGPSMKRYPGELDLSLEGYDPGGAFDGFDYWRLAAPLVSDFFNEKLGDMARYWNQASALDLKYKISMVLWGNCPHRYPGGVMNEYFRINGIPVCGMQHGGMTGTNDIPETMFETELNHCDFFLSYGFSVDDIDTGYVGGVRDLPKILPVGSVSINNLLKSYEILPAGKKKGYFDAVFPAANFAGDFFMECEITNNKLFELQKKIVDRLALAGGRNIAIKFPAHKRGAYHLREYIDTRYPGRFAIIDDISFTEFLKQYDTGLIILEELSTPLFESLITGSNLIVYDAPGWYGLTAKAHKALSIRAAIFSDEDSLLEGISCYFKRGPAEKYRYDRTFFNKYCIHRGTPEKDIEEAIGFIIKDKNARKRDASQDRLHAGPVLADKKR